MVWLAAQNNHGGGGDAAPMGLVVRGWPFPNDGSKFWKNRPSGCQVMGVASAAGVGGGYIFMLHSATSCFSLLGHLKWQAEKEELRGTFDYFSILICISLQFSYQFAIFIV